MKLTTRLVHGAVLCAALIGLTSFGATPTAVWKGSDLANNVTKNGMTLKLNGNTASGGVVTIGSSSVYVDTGMTSSSAHAGLEATVVLTVENVNTLLYSGLFTMTDMFQSDAVGVESYCSYGNVSYLYWVKGGEYMEGTSQLMTYPTDGASHKVALGYAASNSGSGGYSGCAVAFDGTYIRGNAEVINVGYCITRINVGGYQDSQLPLTGARITCIAVYNSALSEADLKKATGEDEPEPEEEVVWGNVGNESTAGVATTVALKAYSSFTVDFGATDNISQKEIGNDGTAKISKVRLFADRNASTKPPTITISQGDTVVTSDSCNFVADQKIYGAYWPATTTHYWTRKAIDATFASETQFDTTKPITISFDETTLCGIQPANSVCVGSDHTPAIEITGKYVANQVLDPMYKNRLSTGVEVIPAGEYGKITVPDGGFKATAFDAATNLSNTESGEEVIGSYTNIIKSTTDIYSHTLAGWFKIDTLPTGTGLTTLYAARSMNATSTTKTHLGYKVAVDSTGKIYVGQCDDEAWRNDSGRSTIYTTVGCVAAGQWFHLAVSIPGRVDATRTTTAAIFVNGEQKETSGGPFGANLNGDRCSYVRIGTKGVTSGLGVSASGIYVDNAALTTPATVVEAALTTPVSGEPTETLDPMYRNRLSSEDDVIEAGKYGAITVPEGGFWAMAFDAAAELSNTPSGDEVSGSYSTIITHTDKTDVRVHTLTGWFKMDALPTESGVDNAKTLYAAKAADDTHGGYKVAVDSDGKIYVGKCNNEAWGNGGKIVTAEGCVSAGQWFHLAVSIPGCVSSSARYSTATIFVNGERVETTGTTFNTNLNGNECIYVRIGTKGVMSGLGISAAGIYVDKAALALGKSIVTAALSAPLPTSEQPVPRPEITRDEAKHTWIVDTTRAPYGFTGTDIAELKATKWTVTLRSQSDYSATIPFGSVSAAQKSHFVIESGTHAMAWVNSGKNINFTTDATAEDPSILVKSGATLNFTARDITGWEGAAQNKTGNVIRVNDGGTLNMLMTSDSNTHYYQGRYWLDPGATLNADSYSSNKFRLNGGAVEGYEQLYVPDTTNGAPAATISAANGINLAGDTTAGLGVFVGENAILNIKAPITGAQVFKKWGMGALVLKDSLEEFTGSLTVSAGTLKLAENVLGGSLVAEAGTTVELAYDGEVEEGAVLLKASSVTLDEAATLLVNGQVTKAYFEGGKLKVGNPPITTCLNPYAVMEGGAIKVSCNAEATAGEAAKAYDGNTSTYFAPGDAADALGVSWTGIEFTNGVIVTRIAYSSATPRRMIGGAFQGANSPDFSDAVNLYVVDVRPSSTVDVLLDEAKGPYKYLRFVGMYGGNVSEIQFYGLADSGTVAPTTAPNITGESVNGVARLTLTPDATIPQVYIVQRAMRNFCDPDGSDYETFVSLAPQLGKVTTWKDTKATGYAMYRAKGFNANGESGWTYFEIEPEKLINGPAAPSFGKSGKPGFYADQAVVTIDYDYPGAKIYYTTDGSAPTTNSTEYTAPITLVDVCESKTNELSLIRTNPTNITGNDYKWNPPNGNQPNVNVIRARAFLPDGSASSNDVAGTWMVGPTANQHKLRVISLQTDFDNYFSDPTGIQVPGDIFKEKGFGSHPVGMPNANYFQSGDDWERPTRIEVFDTDRTEMLAAPIGTRVRGFWSRAAAKKSLTCYFRKEYGQKNAKLKLFGDDGDKAKKFKRFILRNGGNDWYKFGYRDALGHKMFRGYVSTGTQGMEPAVLYINGEYWGLYNFRHCYSKHHFEEWNGGVGDDIDYVKLTPESGDHFELQEGDFSAMWNIMRYMVTCTADGVMSDEEYARVEDEVDIDDMIDYHIVHIFLGNNDWMNNGNNMGYWRNRSGSTDQKWHFTVYDCDSAMSLGGDSYTADHIQKALDINDTNDGSTKMVPGFFKRCFMNEGFKRRFANRYADLLNTALVPERTTGIIAETAAKVEHELTRNVNRWTNIGSVGSWSNQLATVTRFFNNRPSYARQHILSHCSTGAVVSVTLDENEGKGAVKLNTITSGEHFELPFTGQYFTDIPVTLTAMPESGYEFAGWKIGEEVVSIDETIELMPTDGVMIQAVFTEAAKSDQEKYLRLWGFCGAPKTGGADGPGEFIVLTNLNQEASLDLEGAYLNICKHGEDYEIDSSCKITFPNDWQIEAGGYLRIEKSDGLEGWTKIQNGDLKIKFLAANGATIYNLEDALSQKNKGVKDQDKFLKAIAYERTTDDWEAHDNSEAPVKPVPPVPIPDVVLTGHYPDGTNIVLTGDTTIIVSNATFDAGLTISSNCVATVVLPEGTTNAIPKITAEGKLVFDGEGVLTIVGADNLLKLGGDLEIKGGEIVFNLNATKAKAAVANNFGSYLQTGGKVTLNLTGGVQAYGFRWKDVKGPTVTINGGEFVANIASGEGSAAFKGNKGSNDFTQSGGKLTAKLGAVDASVADMGGNVKINGEAIADVTGTEAATHARVFKTEKKVTIGGTATVDVKVPGVESEAFSADNQITVEGGIVRVEACDDCFSAQTNIVVSGGIVYGHSISNDVFDSNGEMTISGGTIIAYTLAEGHEAFDTEPAAADEQSHTFTISGGTIVGLGGKNAAWPSDCDFQQNTFTGTKLDPATYSDKYLVVDGVVETLYAKLPKIDDTFILLATTKELAGDPTVSDTCPIEEPIAEGVPAWRKLKHNQQNLRFAEIYGNTAEDPSGDVGEYFVLTNLSANVVYLKDLEIEITKEGTSTKKSKCHFTVTGDRVVEPYGTYTFEQADWTTAGWEKITNGDLTLKLTDADGKTVQSGETSNDFYPECDGNGASIVAKTFGKELAMTTDDWEPSFRWYYFTTDGETSTITGFGTRKLLETTLTIPRELGKVPVTLVAEGAFADCALTTLKVTLTNETLKVMKTEGAAIAQYDMSESEGELVLGYALGSALNVSGTTVLGSNAATLAFDLGEGTQEVNGTTDAAAKQYGITVYSGTLNFTSTGGNTAFRGRTVVADGENAVVSLGVGDATGYTNPGTLIALRNGGRLDVSSRDTLCTPVELDGGVVKLLANCATGNRGLDLFNAKGNNWTILRDSEIAIGSGAEGTDSRKLLLRNGPWNVDVAEGAVFTVDATVISEASSAGGTRGKIVKTGAGTLYLAATDNTYATATEVVAGTLKLAQSSLAGSLVMNADTTLMLNYAGEIVEGAEVFSAASIVADGVTFIVNSKPLPEGLTLNAENGKLVVGKPKATKFLNPYAVREGVTIKVSCNDLAPQLEAAKAYDNDTSTYFAPGDTANNAGVSWTGIEFTNGVIVTRITFVGRSGEYHRMVGGVFQGANANDFSDAVKIYAVEEYTGGTADVTLEEAKGPFKYLRFIGTHGGNVADIKFYGLPDSGTTAPAAKPDITGESVDGVAQLTLTADATIPQVYIVQRAMRNFCDPDGSDYETFVSLAPQLGESMTWTDRKATGYAMYRAKGFNANGSSDWTYFEMTPEKLINGAEKPSFGGDKPGFYESAASVEITYPVQGAKIYYTTDGSTPTTNSTEYTGPIALADVCSRENPLSQIPANPVDDMTKKGHSADYCWYAPNGDQPNVNVIRARAFMPDGSASTNDIAGTWMIGEIPNEHQLRIVSIQTDAANYFSDETGILVPGDIYKEKGFGSHSVGMPNANYFQKGIDWERPAQIEMFEANHGKEMFSALMGTRAHGNYSRSAGKKTLVCYARKEYGMKNLKKVQLFNDEPEHTKFKRFTLRNGGNDWYQLCLRDAVGQSVFRGEGIDIKTGTQGYEPVVMYINGEYWGLYNLRHAYSKQHFEEWCGAAEDDIDYVKVGASLTCRYELQEGDFISLWNLQRYMINCTGDGVMSDEEYARVENEVDIDDMIDYHIVHIFLGNNDWLGNNNNLGLWRSRSGDDQKWHFTVYDCDSIQNLVNNNDQARDHLTTALGVKDDGDTNDTMPGFLKRCFKNEGFKKRFANRYADLLNTALRTERTTNILARAEARVDHEIARTAARWTNMGSYDSWTNGVQKLYKFYRERPDYQWTYLKNKCSTGSFANITLDACEGNGAVKLNTIESGKHFDLPFTGQYFTDIPVTLTATPESGSVFEGWKIGGQIVSTERTIELMPTEGVAVQAVFAEAGENPQQALRFVEIYGSTSRGSEEEGNLGDVGEFVIITNTSAKAVDLTGMSLESYNRKKSEVTLTAQLTGGSVGAYGTYKLEQDALWSDQKISNGKIRMTLTDSDGVEIQVGITEFDGDADGKGASMVADNLLNPCDAWHVGPIHDPKPTPPEPVKDLIFTGDYPTGATVALTNDTTVILSNATFGAALTFTSNFVATIKVPDGTENFAKSIVATSNKLILDGEGALSVSNNATLIMCAGLTIKNGVLDLELNDNSGKTMVAAEMSGNYLQEGGTVNLRMNCTNGKKKEKSAYGFRWKDQPGCTATIKNGGVFNATMYSDYNSVAFKANNPSNAVTFDEAVLSGNFIGSDGRMVDTKGALTIKGGATVDIVNETDDTSIFKADGLLAVKKATVRVNATGVGSKVFSSEDSIEAGHDNLILYLTSFDKCFNAETNITFTKGVVYAQATAGNVFSTNATLTVKGGTIVALGGTGSQLPNVGDVQQTAYTNLACTAGEWSGKYLVVKSATAAKDVTTTVGMPTLEGAFSMFVTTANMTGEPTATTEEPTVDPVAEGVPVWIEQVAKTFQENLRFYEIYGNTTGKKGDVGEYFVLTNVSDKAVSLVGLKINIGKKDECEESIENAKVKLVLTEGEVEPYGSVKFKQEDYSKSGWEKITNGDLYLLIRDTADAQVQKGYTSNKLYPQCDGKGASLIAKTFGVTIESTKADWKPSYWMPTLFIVK